MVVDHTAAAPYRLIDIDEIDADVVALNTIAWGGPPIGALVFRDPAVIDSFTSVAVNPHATGPERLEVGVYQFGMLAGVVASIEYLASLDESASGSRRERLAVSMQSATSYMNRLFDYLSMSLRSLPLVMVIGRPEVRIPVLSFAVRDVPAERVMQRLADNGSWRSPTPPTHACSTSSGSTTLAVRSPSGWPTTRPRPRLTSWCVHWHR